MPRDKDCFKIRCNVEKELHICVTPSPTTGGSYSSVAASIANQQQQMIGNTINSTSAAASGGADAGLSLLQSPCEPLVIERCFGLLIAPGHRVKHADMNLLEMVPTDFIFTPYPMFYHRLSRLSMYRFISAVVYFYVFILIYMITSC